MGSAKRWRWEVIPRFPGSPAPTGLPERAMHEIEHGRRNQVENDRVDWIKAHGERATGAYLPRRSSCASLMSLSLPYRSACLPSPPLWFIPVFQPVPVK